MIDFGKLPDSPLMIGSVDLLDFVCLFDLACFLFESKQTTITKAMDVGRLIRPLSDFRSSTGGTLVFFEKFFVFYLASNDSDVKPMYQ
jgi:hypothetical protein